MTTSCSWCHEMNDLSVSNICSNCGHRADLSRMEETAAETQQGGVGGVTSWGPGGSK